MSSNLVSYHINVQGAHFNDHVDDQVTILYCSQNNSEKQDLKTNMKLVKYRFSI